MQGLQRFGSNVVARLEHCLPDAEADFAGHRARLLNRKSVAGHFVDVRCFSASDSEAEIYKCRPPGTGLASMRR